MKNILLFFLFFLYFTSCTSTNINIPKKYKNLDGNYLICIDILNNQSNITKYCNDTNFVTPTFIESFCQNERRITRLSDIIDSEFSSKVNVIYDKFFSGTHSIKVSNIDSTMFIRFQFNLINGKNWKLVDILYGKYAEYEL